MTCRLAVVFAAAVTASTGAVAPAHAQNFPDHPIKVVVPYPAGGPADTVARVTTQGLGAELGGSVIIENVVGAGGRLATKDVTRATPDGYTLLLSGSNEYAITPALYKDLDYNPAKQLVPVAAVATAIHWLSSCSTRRIIRANLLPAPRSGSPRISPLNISGHTPAST